MRNFYNRIIRNHLRGQVKPSDMADVYLAFTFLRFKRYRMDLKELFEYATSITQLISEDSQEIIKDAFKQLKPETIYDLIDVYFEEKNDADMYNETGNPSLYKLVCKLLKLETGDKVYDMGCGTGHFLYEVCRASNKVNSQLVIQGIEINASNLLIARMVLELVYVQNKVQLGDALYYDIKSFNKAFVFPPLGMKYKDDTFLRFNTKNRTYINSKTSTEWFFIDRLVSNLHENGKVIALLPQRCLFFDGDQDYRRFLLENKLIEGIIQLPQGALTNTSISSSLVVFSYNNDKIKVLDASKYATKETFRSVNLDYESINKDYLYYDIQTSINIEDISAPYDLTINKLLSKPIEVKYSTPINKVGEIFQGSQYTIANFKDQLSETKTNTRLLASIDIEEGMIQWDSLNSIINPDKKILKYALKKNDIVITSKSSKVKIAVVDVDLDDTVILTGGMLCVRPNVDIIIPEYLKMFLDSTKGKEILKSIQKGATIQSITKSALESIYISCPPIDKQIEVTKKYQSKLTMYAALKKELEDLEEQINSYYDEVEGDL